MRRTGFAVTLVLIAASALAAHDLFLKPQRYFVGPDEPVGVNVLNGNFERSEAALAQDRVLDLSVVGPAGREHPRDVAWKTDSVSASFTVRTGAAGTYVVGVSTGPRVLALTAADFNEYLRGDGVPDVLEARRRAGELEKPVREQYSKHVKAVLQAGEARTAGFDTPLGYPAELVPLDNPYALAAGAEMRLRALVDGRPVANQFVMAGGRTPTGQRHPVQTPRTDADGIVRVKLAAGTWYVKFIHMVPMPTDSTDYQSKWGSLTFEVR